MLFVFDKDFSLCDNYPKIRGKLFREWIDTYHPGALILHVEKTLGSLQYLDVEGGVAVYMNLPYWI